MHIVKRPLPLAPYACAATGRDDLPMVDFQIETSGMDQPLYLTTSVIQEAAKLIGMVPGDEVRRIEKKFAKLESQFEEVRAVAKMIAKVEETKEAAALADSELEAAVLDPEKTLVGKVFNKA